MSILQKIVLTMLFSLMLTGCQEKVTYSYLMQHPDELKRAIAACQAMNEKTPEQTSQCKMVIYATSNMIAIVSQLQEDPEKFGQRVMDAEVAYVKATDELHTAQQALADLQNKKAPAADLTAAKENVEKAKEAVDEKDKEIKVILAVLGLNSPE